MQHVNQLVIDISSLEAALKQEILMDFAYSWTGETAATFGEIPLIREGSMALSGSARDLAGLKVNAHAVLFILNNSPALSELRAAIGKAVFRNPTSRVVLLDRENSEIRALYAYKPVLPFGACTLPEKAGEDHKYRISFCIPTYNRIEILQRCIDGIERDYLRAISINPDLAGRIEVIIVDDGSSDDTSAIVPALQGKVSFPMQYHRIENSGPARARNIAFENSDGDIICYIDDDKILHPGYIDSILAFHERHPSPQAACVGFVDWPDYLDRTFLMDHVVSSKGGQQFGFSVIDRFNQNELPPEFFVTANLSLKTEFISRFRLFDAENFRDAMWEDCELGYRLIQYGLKLHYWPEAIVYHDHLMTLESFGRRQFKVGQYVGRLSRNPFMQGTKSYLDAIADEPAIKIALEKYSLSDLVALMKKLESDETFFQEKIGAIYLGDIYNWILAVAMIHGSKSPHVDVKDAWHAEGDGLKLLLEYLTLSGALGRLDSVRMGQAIVNRLRGIVAKGMDTRFRYFFLLLRFIWRQARSLRG